MNFLWVLLTFLIFVIFIYWGCTKLKYKIQLNKLRRKYNAEENKSRRGNPQGEFRRDRESENPESVSIGDEQSLKRELLQDDVVELSGQNKPEHTRSGTRRRRIRRRKK